MSRPLAMFLMLSVLAAATGCTRFARFEPGPPVSDSPLRQDLTDRIAAAYPDTFVATHRVLLEIGGSERVFTLQTSGLPERIEVVGLGDFGKTLFIVRRLRGQSWTVVRSRGGYFSDARLTRLVSVAVRMSLMTPLGADGDIRRGRDGETLLVAPIGDDRSQVVSFDRHGAVQSGLLVRGGRVWVSAAYDLWKANPPWPHPAPSLVTIDDHRGRYRLSLELVSLEERRR